MFFIKISYLNKAKIDAVTNHDAFKLKKPGSPYFYLLPPSSGDFIESLTAIFGSTD
jgi:hypothetical protein